MHGHGQIAARGGDLSAGRRVPVPLCSRWRIAPPSPLAPDHQTTGATAARRRGRAHTARQAERARPEAGRLTAFSRWPRTQPRRGPRPQLSRPSLGGRGHSCFLPPYLKFSASRRASATGKKGGLLGGKKTPRARPQERARAADAKPNASKPPTQAPGGKPRARRKGAKATRQPVARTHERARPAAKPTRPTTERRPAGAGATAPHHAHQRRRDHASGRRNGGEAGGDGAGRAALGRRSKPPTPCHQRRAPH